MTKAEETDVCMLVYIVRLGKRSCAARVADSDA